MFTPSRPLGIRNGSPKYTPGKALLSKTPRIKVLPDNTKCDACSSTDSKISKQEDLISSLRDELTNVKEDNEILQERFEALRVERAEAFAKYESSVLKIRELKAELDSVRSKNNEEVCLTEALRYIA